MHKDLLFEIGLEEVPARFMPGALEQLQNKTKEIFDKNRLQYQNIESYGTPRRLTLYVTELQARQEDLVEEAKGPSKNVAFDEDGNPTKAAIGFARGKGVNIEDLVVKETQNGEYVFAQVRKEGKNTSEVLPEILKEVIFSLSFPKPMRWGDCQMRFARPIRWLLALYGEEMVPVQIEEVVAGNETYGHRFLSSGKITINKPEQYFEKLKEHYVIVDQSERREMIWQQIIELAQSQGGKVKEDRELLEEVTYLLEYPTALCGNFAENFLELPQEALITPMKEHQRYFPVWDGADGLLAKFITVRNGTEDHIDIVTAGNEKVLEARLADAKFFYEEDTKIPLSHRVEKLKNVVFQEKLGTVYDKVERIKSLSEYLSEELKLSPQAKENSLRCAYLAKADLVTSMVYEFTELQGIMGEYYARHDGEPEEVCKGIREHYMPRFSGDDIPESTVGTVVAIADKIDTIVGCFAVGIQPTGSQDPYALRRQAQGICYMIKEKDLDLSLQDLISRAYNNYRQKLQLELTEEEVIQEVGSFFQQRLANIMEEEGIKYDVVNAVLASGWENGADVFRRAHALTAFKEKEEFEALLIAFTRAGNLAKKATTDNVDENYLKEEVEKKLWEQFLLVQQETAPMLQKGDYFDALVIISGLREPIDDFFNGVMVMVDDENVKNNRLALLKSISDYMGRIADLSQIVS